MPAKKYNKYEVYADYGIGYTFKDEPFAFSSEDFEKIRDICWHRDTKGYIAGYVDGKLVRMHRFLLNPPEGMVIDHKNHCLTDNRRENLAIVTPSQNMQNMMPRRANEVGCNGVTRTDSGRWQVTISVNGKSTHLGTFDSLEEAIEARKAAEKKYFGEYSYDANLAQAEEIGYLDVPGIIPEVVTNYETDEMKAKRLAAKEKAEGRRKIAEEKAEERRRIAEERKRIAEEKAAERKRRAEEKEALRQKIAEEKEAERKRKAEEKKAKEKKAKESAVPKIKNPYHFVTERHPDGRAATIVLTFEDTPAEDLAKYREMERQALLKVGGK